MRWILYWVDVACALGFAIYVFMRASWDAQTVIGLVATVSGAVLWVTARLQLGASFAIEPQARKLVTHGLYTRFRHPVYLFGQLTFVGLAIAWRQWFGYLAAVLIWAVQMYRMRREDAVLERAFGEEFRRY